MHRLRSLSVGILSFALLATAACGPAATSATPVAEAPTPPAPAATTPPPERVDGMVQSLADGTLTLTSGRSISVPATVRVTRSTSIAAPDLHSGDYVAITGTRQP